MAWLVASLQRLRRDRLAFVGLAVLVFVTAIAAAGLPRIFESVSTDSVHTALADLPSTDRELVLSQVDEGMAPQYGDWGAVLTEGSQLRASFPEPLPALLGATTAMVETPSYRALGGTSLAAELRLRIMEGVASHIRYVAGRAPTGATTAVPNPLGSAGSGGIALPGSRGPTVLQLEAAVSSSAARKLGLHVGSSVFMAPDATLDPLSGGSALAAKVVGIFEADDVSDPYWTDDARVVGWTLREFSSNVTFVQSTFLISPQVYGVLVSGISDEPVFGAYGQLLAPSRRLSWRYPADPARVAPGQLDALVAGLRRLEGSYPPGGGLQGSGPALQTSLLNRLVALEAPWNAAEEVLVVAGIGAAGVAIATLGLVILVVSEERRRTLLLQRERGASGSQAVTAIVLEGMLMALPAAALAALAVLILMPGGNDGSAILIAGVVAGMTVLIQLGTLIRSVVGPPRGPGREASPARAVSARRLVLEALVVLLAILGAITLHARGLSPAVGPVISGAAGVAEPTSVVPGGGPDLFLAAVPALVGIAAALLALRLVPFAIGGLARLVALRRDLGPTLASRRAARSPGATRVLLIILTTTTLGAFAFATVLHLQRTADLQAWQDVGASVRIDASADPSSGSSALPAGLDLAHLAGAEAVATMAASPVSFATGGPQQLLVALDPSVYATVVAGTPAAVRWPASLLATPGTGGSGASGAAPGSDADPMPAVVASSQESGPFGLGIGDHFVLALGARNVTFRVVGMLDRFPGLPVGAPFVVVSEAQLQAADPGAVAGTTSAFVRLAPDGLPRLRDALRTAAPQAVLSVQAAEAASLATRPVVQVVAAGVLALAGLAALYATLAVLAAFLLAASARAAETAHLAVLGLSDRQARTMLLVEYGPATLLAVVAGAGLGLGLFAYLEPGLGFGAIVGVVQTAAPGIDPTSLGLLVAMAAAILVLGVTLGAPAQRRAAATAVREGLT
jgi:putative ABC transport system permease protein